MLTLAAIALAALLAWTMALRDDVMLAKVTGASGDFDFVPIRDGKVLDAGAAADRGDTSREAKRSGDEPTASDGTSDGTGTTGTGTGTGPGTAETPPPPIAPGVTIDGFNFTAGDNLAPGESQTGEITLRNTGDEPADVRMDVTGSDPFGCFRFAATPAAKDASGAWVPVGDARLGGSPATGGSAPIGTWNAGQEYRLHLRLAMTRECTVGSGLSSGGSTALASRHPDHATARLQFRFVAEGRVS